jgi:hypothetical protein
MCLVALGFSVSYHVKHRRENTPGTTTQVSRHSKGYLLVSEDLK